MDELSYQESSPAARKERAAARGLYAWFSLQHPFIPTRDAPPKFALTMITVSTAIFQD
jgi:hypothetical protein